MLGRKLAKAGELHRSDETSRVSLNQLLDLVIEDYRSKDRHTTYDVEHRVDKHLRPFFGTKAPFEITVALLEQYVGSRKGKAAPATVNKELAYLRRALRLGYRHDPQLVDVVPSIPLLPIGKSRIFAHDDPISEQLNQRLVLQLERHIRAKDRQLSGSDMVLDKNAESP